MRTLLTADGLKKTYGRQVVLDGLSLGIPEKARIALIGRNGCGKSTLLRLLSGRETADAGEVSLMSETRLGVLDQDEILPAGGTVAGYLAEATGRPDWDCRKLAARFGLHADEMDAVPSELSGGYQMRVKIVRMLLLDPNLLLLDEPVNYLDLPTLLLLEAFLRRWSGAYVITSHDREILQNLCLTTWEIGVGGKMAVFPGDVETYLDWKEEQAGFALKTNKKLRREIGHAQDFVDRFHAKATMASRAENKRKHITKLRARLRSLDEKTATAAFRIPCPEVVAGTAVRCQDLAIGYGGQAVAAGIELEIMRGAKVAIVGENGRGKSTLLRTLAGSLPPVGGSVKWWHRADIGYFSQQSEETLNPQETVLAALTRAAPPSSPAERILAAAGAFLFHDDDLDKPCGVLSGGERARVRLARLILHEHNVLLLDEPTNHLDAETVEVLARAIKEYAGTVFIVSHARTFMNAVADRIYEVRNGTMRLYPGTYEEYVAELTAQAEETDTLPGSSSGPTAETGAKREAALLERERRRTRQKLENKLKEMEHERGQILKYFFENPTEYSPEKSRRLAELEEMISTTENEWLKSAE